MPATIVTHARLDDLPTDLPTWVIGRRDRLRADDIRRWLGEALTPATWDAMLGRSDPGDDGRTNGTWIGDPPRRIVAGVLPERCSRHNTPTRAWAVPRLLSGMPRTKDTVVVLATDDPDHRTALALAVGRALPRYDGTSKGGSATVHVAVIDGDGRGLDPAHTATLIEAVRRAAAWTDRPTNDLDTTAFVADARAVAELLPSVRVTVVSGEDLRDQGFGGLWGVGKAASSPPAMVVLEHEPEGAVGHDAWVGKGIVYDTGGLSLKSKTSMPGMKADMAGAGAVLAAFEAAVQLGCRRRLTAVLCLAENAVGPDATRPDDVLTMHSGLRVEVNNTDAEGRLVLADGVSWVTRERHPDRLVDIATLTGAQAVATGKRHAAVVSNDDGLEAFAVESGRATGDLCHPLPFVPEFLVREFRSPVADLRNSVKDRANAQSSCAAEFVRQHVARDELPWLHVDMAGPGTHAGRGTGFGVGLLLRLCGAA